MPQPLFRQFYGTSLASIRRPHLLRRAACWISQPYLSRFRWIFFEFCHLVPICHLENFEILDISVVMVLSPSETHRLEEIFEVYVWQRKAIVISKFAFSPKNFFVCFAVWLCFPIAQNAFATCTCSAQIFDARNNNDVD